MEAVQLNAARLGCFHLVGTSVQDRLSAVAPPLFLCSHYYTMPCLHSLIRKQARQTSYPFARLLNQSQPVVLKEQEAGVECTSVLSMRYQFQRLLVVGAEGEGHLRLSPLAVLRESTDRSASIAINPR